MDTSRLLSSDKTGIGFGRGRGRGMVLDSVKNRKQAAVTSHALSSFIASMSGAFDLRLLERDVRAAEKVIAELDTRHHVCEHSLWAETADTETGAMIGASDAVTSEQYDNDVAFSSSSAEEHQRPSSASACADTADDADDDASCAEIPGDSERLEVRLFDCVSYLRTEYSYCMYCGCAFDDQSDLQTNCPGEARAAH